MANCLAQTAPLRSLALPRTVSRFYGPMALTQLVVSCLITDREVTVFGSGFLTVLLGWRPSQAGWRPSLVLFVSDCGLGYAETLIWLLIPWCTLASTKLFNI